MMMGNSDYSLEEAEELFESQLKILRITDRRENRWGDRARTRDNQGETEIKVFLNLS